ncbi:cilia- and flagella-associated protein 61-like [Folsomia candida]|uniref:cilia- and flagella-associated protein 61-like n=1 Tax=Folsomia candida TaxID=158441 RepID=UPI001604F063|nr:cilia- and flagella-associated protein 61-like [Folsomia candida]
MQGETNLVFKKETPKPKNVFTVNTEVEGEIALKFIKNYIPFMKRKKILIFGAGLRCFACIKSLLLAGVTANRIVIIDTPNFEVEWEAKAGYNMTNTVRIPMEQELKRLGVYWVQNYEFSDWETCPISGLVKRSYFSSPTEKESKISFSTFAFFCFRHRRVNDDLVSALAESYILFQDGIIIDENFKTNDPNIYAAGPATTYKRILLASHHDHMYYQSEEVGHKLAEFLISRVGSEGGGVAEIQTLEVFKFKRPFVRAIELLGGWHYMVMRSPGAPHHTRWLDSNGKCEETCECTTEIVTGSVDPKEDPHQKYFKVQLDDQSRIVGIECMSKRPFSASNFTGLYGQHEVLLNKMMERLEKGETKDLYDHFCQPWFGAFCVDQWETFLLELQELYRTQDIEDGHKIADFIRDYVANLDNPESIQVDPNIIRNIWDSSGLKQEVELKFLAFLKFNKLALPMYARNDYVEDLLEERSSSTLYYPKVVKY